MSEVWVIESDGEPITVECAREDLPDVMSHRNEQLERYVPERQLNAWRLWQSNLVRDLGLTPSCDEMASLESISELAKHGHRVRTTTNAIERMASIMVETQTDGYVRQSARLAEQLEAVRATCAGTSTGITKDDPLWSPALEEAQLLREELEERQKTSAVRVAYKAWADDPTETTLTALEKAMHELPCPYCRSTGFIHKMSCYAERAR